MFHLLLSITELQQYKWAMIIRLGIGAIGDPFNIRFQIKGVEISPIFKLSIFSPAHISISSLQLPSHVQEPLSYLGIYLMLRCD